MEKNCGIFIVEKNAFCSFLDLNFTLKIFWTMFELGLSFQNSELDLNRKI